MNGKLVAITGASKGLGAFLAQQFWQAGASLLLIGRYAAPLQELIAELPSAGTQQAAALVCDLADPSSVAMLEQRLRDTYPHVSTLINNAAIQGPIGPLWMNSVEDWQTAMQVNLLAPMALCRAVLPAMIALGHGSIINLSGGGATGPRANFSAYATAKAGLVRFSETLAEEAKAHGVKVNCIAPGAMKTAMLGEVLAKGVTAAGTKEFDIAQKVFAEGGASMERVAQLALFLASSDSDGITGKLISAVWDNWGHWPEHKQELAASDVYTLRRIAGRDRGMEWGDK